MNWRLAFEPVLTPVFRTWWRVSRGMTLGVRGFVQDEQGRVVLVRHTYMPGWYLPGGGVERGEPAATSLARELREEAGVDLTEPPEFLGIYSNHKTFRGDHVVVYRALGWTPCEPDFRGEIDALEWFDPEDLPEEATSATRARIAEALGQKPVSPYWTD